MENKVYAVVGEKEITQDQVNEFLQSIGPQNAMQLQNEEGTKRIVDELVSHELLYLDALESGLQEEEGFKAELEKVKSNLLKQYSIQKILSEASVSDEEIAEYYERNKAMFVEGEKVRASHILVDSEEKAGEIAESIKSGAEFESQAAEFSSCPSKDRGGDLGEFQRGSMVPEFEDAAFGMEIGDVSDPVKTQFGYHIIKLTDKKPSEDKSLEEVKENIKNQLLGLRQQEVYYTKVDDLKKKYTVEFK